MKLTKLEQSGFIFEAQNGFTLALDIGTYTPKEKLAGVSPDAMIVSHLHGDHFSIENIKGLCPKKLYLSRECIELLGEESIACEIVEIKADEEIDIQGIKVKIFDVDHGPNVKVRPRENFGFLFEIDNEKIYFAGDMFYSSGLDVSKLEVDLALIPVGTFYTFGPSEAIQFAHSFGRLKKVISMHYQKTPETKEQFLQLAKDKNIEAE